MCPAPKSYFDSAIDNISQFGDTDIFPFPIENLIFYDKKPDIVKLLRKSYSYFDDCFTGFPPSHISALSPIGTTGFRWATQQDPYWNAFLLGITLLISEQIENSRIPIDRHSIFSYRIANNFLSGRLFRDDVGWKEFIETSISYASSSPYVVLCDIADCYQRIPHHRLENALQQLRLKNQSSYQIMQILSNFSGTKSYGVPVGGPAARILVELVFSLTDSLLKTHGIKFCRYADDYHVFAASTDDAYQKLNFLTEKLLRNDGLTLQKSKTRIMSSAEFVSSMSIHFPNNADSESDIDKLFSLNLRFDPYSSKAEEEYEELREELNNIDILGLLNMELAKTRVHGALTKKLISSVRFLEPSVKERAILTLVDSLDNLYPIFPVVATVVRSCFLQISTRAQDTVCTILRERIISNSFIFGVELNAAYAIRILSGRKSADNVDVLVALYNRFSSPLVRRDIILVMAKWREYPWLADRINDYQGVSPWEKRAFIIASYFMGDSGKHWREHMKRYFNPLETLVRDWMAEKTRETAWELPV